MNLHSIIFVFVMLACGAGASAQIRVEEPGPDSAQAKLTKRLRESRVLFPENRKPKGSLLADLVLAQVHVKDLPGALDTYKALLREEDWWWIYPSFAELPALQAESGDFEGALKTIDAPGPHEWWQRFANTALITVAKIAKRRGRPDIAETAWTQALERTGKMNKGKGDTKSLFALAQELIAEGEFQQARKARDLLDKASEDERANPETRAMTLARPTILDARLAGSGKAKGILMAGFRAVDQKLPASGNALRLFASALAEVCEKESELPDEISYADLAKFQIAKGNLEGAARTLKQMTDDRERDRFLETIAQAHLLRGETAKAIAVGEGMRAEHSKAIAMLNIATKLAQSGFKKQARELVDGLTYPKKRGTFSPPDLFNLGDHRTWGVNYQFNGFITGGSMIAQANDAGDLTEAAMRCRVTLEEHGNIQYSEELEQWQVRKPARAQAAGGDTEGAFAWVDRLSPAQRLEALFGLAEGRAHIKQ